MSNMDKWQEMYNNWLSEKYIVVSSICCFDSELYAYKMVRENGTIVIDTSTHYHNVIGDLCYSGISQTANAAKYYHNNFDKWKLFYMALSKRGGEFRDIFRNMVEYYCAF